MDKQSEQVKKLKKALKIYAKKLKTAEGKRKFCGKTFLTHLRWEIVMATSILLFIWNPLLTGRKGKIFVSRFARNSGAIASESIEHLEEMITQLPSDSVAA